MTARSIKYAYPDASGKISRGSPELPFDILVDMLVLAGDQKEIDESLPTLGDPNLADPATMSDQDLKDEKTVLSTTLIRLQPLVVAVRWAEWSVYDQIGARLDAIRAEIARR
ncbi:hypothetical protein [Sphingomonas sp.]|uniref:hypothetical protein n=1 Tax=Sphingomonas sp. TaxID=28214 RepID=UPI003566CB72